MNRVPPCLVGVKPGTFTCVGWQVTLCDPILQVTPRSSEMDFHEELYTALTFNLCNVVPELGIHLYCCVVWCCFRVQDKVDDSLPLDDESWLWYKKHIMKGFADDRCYRVFMSIIMNRPKQQYQQRQQKSTLAVAAHVSKSTSSVSQPKQVMDTVQRTDGKRTLNSSEQQRSSVKVTSVQSEKDVHRTVTNVQIDRSHSAEKRAKLDSVNTQSTCSLTGKQSSRRKNQAERLAEDICR